ncbi:pentapeptide repeat-containing protein [Streptosporangium vulgare]|uniref:Pentapeptide repeat-containing protein n=1 Tax=Streptosporangium vulgare TaxID=46190 RepID=A0ABV5TST6_9ACTN
MRRQAVDRANPRGTVLRGAELRGTGFRGEGRGRADFRGTDLRGTDRERATFRGAGLGRADLRRADRGLLLPRRLPEPPAPPARRHRSPGRPAAAGP